MTAIYNRKGKCPRCGVVYEFPEGIDEIDCNCHLYCDQGSKPSDCVTEFLPHDVNDSLPFPFTLLAAAHRVQAGVGDLKWPFGVHDNCDRGGEDVLHRLRWCSTHSKFIEKPPLLVKCFEGERYSRQYRWHRGET